MFRCLVAAQGSERSAQGRLVTAQIQQVLCPPAVDLVTVLVTLPAKGVGQVLGPSVVEVQQSPRLILRPPRSGPEAKDALPDLAADDPTLLCSGEDVQALHVSQLDVQDSEVISPAIEPLKGSLQPSHNVVNAQASSVLPRKAELVLGPGHAVQTGQPHYAVHQRGSPSPIIAVPRRDPEGDLIPNLGDLDGAVLERPDHLGASPMVVCEILPSESLEADLGHAALDGIDQGVVGQQAVPLRIGVEDPHSTLVAANSAEQSASLAVLREQGLDSDREADVGSVGNSVASHMCVGPDQRSALACSALQSQGRPLSDPFPNWDKNSRREQQCQQAAFPD